MTTEERMHRERYERLIGRSRRQAYSDETGKVRGWILIGISGLAALIVIAYMIAN